MTKLMQFYGACALRGYTTALAGFFNLRFNSTPTFSVYRLFCFSVLLF